jgi:hypothetical protein
MDEAGGLNLYAACGNDLVNRVDPLGLVFMPPRGTEGPSPGALLEYEAKQAFYEAARHVFTTPQWTGMFDDWYNEAGLNPITITGISDSRNSDIAQNPGFMKMLGCYAHMLLDKTVVPTGLDGGSWIDTNKGQFRWHFNYDPFAAPGGLAAYTDATWFLGSYIATVNDEGGGKFGISVNNVTGWASATAIPYTNHQTTIWPDTFRGHGTGTPYLPSHGGDWTEYFNFETTATCGSCQFP